MALAPRPQTTGPVHLYTSINALTPRTQPPGDGAFPHYLGTCREFPRISIRRFYRDVFRDINGLSVPADKLFDSYDAMIIADLNRWSYEAYENLQKMPGSEKVAFFGSNDDPGTIKAEQIGAMTVLENAHEVLWLQYPYSTKTIAFPNMPTGLRFPTTILFGPDELEPGLRPFGLRLVWYAMKHYTVESATRKIPNRLMDVLFAASSPAVESVAIGVEAPAADQVLFDYNFGDGPDPSIGQPQFGS